MDACGFDTDDFSWNLAWTSANPGYLYYYFDGYGFYPQFAADFDDTTGALQFGGGYYAYPYYGYYYTRYWDGNAEVVVY